MSLKQILFSPYGRMDKNAYWIYFMVLAIAYAVFLVLPAFSFYSAFPEKFTLHYLQSTPKISDIIFLSMMGLLLVSLSFLFLYSSIVMSVKRLHDRNKSGWWLVIFFILPSILDIIAELCSAIPTIGSSLSVFLYMMSYLFYIWGYVELSFLGSDQGLNPFDAKFNVYKKVY